MSPRVSRRERRRKSRREDSGVSPASSDHPVLLCYDGSEAAAAAIAVAARILVGRDAVVGHVWAGLSRAIFHSDAGELPAALMEAAEELDALDREAAEGLTAAGVRLASDAGFRAEPLTIRERRKTWRTLLEAADEHGASVVVTGAHGLSGPGRLLLGSVSTTVLNHSDRPVLVVPAAAPRNGGGPLLLCYDGSDSAARAIRAAGTLCSSRSAVVVNLWQSWVTEAPVLAGVARPVNAMTEELDQIATELSETTVAEGVRVATEAGFDAHSRSACSAGSLWRSLLDLADEDDADALVLGARGLTGLSRVLGSVSNGVVHHSRRPVLVVPEPPAS
jgi:nucleotide-binding universal stress UspA family protein